MLASPTLIERIPLLAALLAFSAIAFAAVVPAQASDVNFQNLREGWELDDLQFEPLDLFGNRSAGRIQAIAQTDNGLIWVGSRQGLFRYDGRRIRAFSRDPLDPASLPSDSVTALHVDAQKRLWVGTEQGIALYQPDTEQFVRYLQPQLLQDTEVSNQVNGIAHGSDGAVYAANESGRVFRFDESQSRFTPVTERRFGAIKSLAVDPLDRLWIGSDDDLSVLDPRSLSLDVFEEPFATDDRITVNYVTSISYVDDSEVWLGTTMKGVLVLNSLTRSFEALPYRSQAEAYVNKVSVDLSGRVWSANNAGLTLFDRETRTPLSTPDQNARHLNTPPSGINALFVDHQGALWAGSNYDGVSKATSYKRFETVDLHERNPEVRPNAPVSAFLEDRQGNLWVGHPKSGLAMYSRHGDGALRIAHDPDDPASLTPQPILSLFEDSRSQIWIGTYRGGLYRYDPASGELSAFRHDPQDPHSIGGHDIRAIAESDDGTLWFATHGNGLIRFERSSGRFSNYTVGNRDETGFHVHNDWINTLLVDRQQHIWLGARNGVARIAPDRKTYTHFLAGVPAQGSLSNSRTNDLFEDSKGRIWVATKDGLNLFLPETQRFKSYSVSDGIPDRAVTSIVEDDQGYLWLGTLDGLARFDPTSGKARSYDTSDGLVSDDFFEASAGRGIGGALYFGQNKGLTRFDPEEIVDDTDTPQVFVTGLRLFGEPLEVTPEGPLTQSLLNTSKIQLQHDQNALVFEFVAVDFKNPVKNQYRYKLDGFDKDWSQASTRAEAVYTNIPPGNYLFRVQAANIDGYWNEDGDSLAVQIATPVWSTPGFKVAIALLLISTAVALFFWRISSIRHEARRLEIAVAERTKDLKQANIWLEEANAKTQTHGELLERTVKQRTRELEVAKEKAEHSDRLKSAFLANMSHEIRTPMNAIIGFLHMLESSDLSPEERKHFHEIINQSSKSLMALIDDILDLSAIEAGEAEISPQACNIDELCEELGALFRESLLAQKKGKVAFKVERQLPPSLEGEGPLVAVTDPLRLKQILWNLLSNALKFTDEGEIRLRVAIRESQPGGNWEIEYSVKDTGIGIPRDQHRRIFERFHKLDESGKKLYRGTGLGLTITHTLTALMHGTITLESEPRVGTEFFVTFPFSSALEDPAVPPADPLPRPSSLEADFSGYTLLVVEDEVPNFEYIKGILKNTGIAIHWVDRGGAALETFKSQPFDLVLLDLKLPEVGGHDLAAQFRAVDPSVPIIVQSAYAMREDILRSKNAGANEHLSKPFNPQELVALLSKYLGPADIR